MDPMRTTIEVIAPITAGLLGMILFPAVSLWVVMQFVKLPLEGDFLCKYTLISAWGYYNADSLC